jgi:putative SOS response-associated peptidase YedK
MMRKGLRNQQIFIDGDSAIIAFMCGRYRLSKRKQMVEEYFDTTSNEADWNPRYNIAPTQPVPVIRQNPKEPRRELSLLRWGLIPSWAKGASGAPLINARSETAATTPAFRDALKLRRCLIPADGFYEWQRSGKAKQPYCFEVNAGELFAFAGLWDRWKNPNGQWLKSCSILTTTPNAVTSAVHDRMPVILGRSDYDLWLDPGMKDAITVSELLKPYDALQMQCFPISLRINHVANDDEECSTPVDLAAQTQTRLFL